MSYADYKPGDKPSGKDYTFILRWIAYAERLEREIADMTGPTKTEHEIDWGLTCYQLGNRWTLMSKALAEARQQIAMDTQRFKEIEELGIARDLQLEAVKRLVSQQALDEGLWFFAQTASEEYLQEALRTLHAVIECGSCEAP